MIHFALLQILFSLLNTNLGTEAISTASFFFPVTVLFIEWPNNEYKNASTKETLHYQVMQDQSRNKTDYKSPIYVQQLQTGGFKDPIMNIPPLAYLSITWLVLHISPRQLSFPNGIVDFGREGARIKRSPLKNSNLTLNPEIIDSSREGKFENTLLGTLPFKLRNKPINFITPFHGIPSYLVPSQQIQPNRVGVWTFKK